MVNFLLLIEELIEYNKKDIDRGQTPPKIYELCSCIREAFCLSYSIRKNNNLYLYFQKEHIFVSFLGNELRYLGPDERSQALLLEKALKTAKGINLLGNNGKEKSTPGIYVIKFSDNSSFISHFNQMSKGNNYLILDHEDSLQDEYKWLLIEKDSKKLDDGSFFLIPVYPISEKNLKCIAFFEEMKNIKFFTLSKIKQVEDKILYINYRKDHQGTL